MERADAALYASKRAGRNRVSKADWKATAGLGRPRLLPLPENGVSER